MTVVVCLSDGEGMLFNKRRQSRDRALIKDVADMCGEKKALCISGFSEKYLKESGIAVCVFDNPLKAAGDGDVVFVENLPLAPYLYKIKRLVIYRWNRTYPTDFKIDINPEKSGMTLVSTLDFQGYSHEKITKEIWNKKGV